MAAGEGSRLGLGAKALLEFDNQAQVVRAVRMLKKGGCNEVIVVAGAQSDAVRQVLSREQCRIVTNPAWNTGIGSSFKIGVSHASRLLEDSSNGFVLIALVDQPDIHTAVVHRLCETILTSRVKVAGYANASGNLVRGHPLIFPIAMAREAASMAYGDAAGREWIRKHSHLVDIVDMTDLATGRDIDTLSDLETWTSGGFKPK